MQYMDKLNCPSLIFPKSKYSHHFPPVIPPRHFCPGCKTEKRAICPLHPLLIQNRILRGFYRQGAHLFTVAEPRPHPPGPEGVGGDWGQGHRWCSQAVHVPGDSQKCTTLHRTLCFGATPRRPPFPVWGITLCLSSARRTPSQDQFFTFDGCEHPNKW